MHTRHFDTYKFTRFSWVREIDVHLIDAQDQPPQGGGEHAIIFISGCIANAISEAKGARVNPMSMTPERVLEAMKLVYTQMGSKGRILLFIHDPVVPY
jgi:CO/xanthine dehydrogenase Mo-binding subunit